MDENNKYQWDNVNWEELAKTLLDAQKPSLISSIISPRDAAHRHFEGVDWAEPGKDASVGSLLGFPVIESDYLDDDEFYIVQKRWPVASDIRIETDRIIGSYTMPELPSERFAHALLGEMASRKVNFSVSYGTGADQIIIDDIKPTEPPYMLEPWQVQMILFVTFLVIMGVLVITA